MAKVKYNVKGVDRGGNFEQPKPGLYEMEIMEANARLDNGKNDIELVLEVTKGNTEHAGARIWTYVSLGEASQWKLAELTDALGLPESGQLDTDKLVGKKMKVKVNADSWNNEYRARAGRFAPLESEATDADPEADPDADGGDAGDDPDATTAAGDDEPIVMELNDVELSTDPAYYEDWSDDEIFEEVDNQDLKLGRKKKSRENVIALLIAKIEEAAQAGDDGEGGSEGDGEATDEYDDADTWSDKDLAAEYKKRGLDTITGKKDRAKVIAALREDDAAGDDDPFAD